MPPFLSSLSSTQDRSLQPRRIAVTLGCWLALLLCLVHPSQCYRTFTSSVSQGVVTTVGSTVLERTLSPNVSHAVLHYLWLATSPPDYADFLVFDYYIDDDVQPSLSFTPAAAAGTVFHNYSAVNATWARPPWSTQWMGQNALDSGWFNTFRVPFYRSCRVVARLPFGVNHFSVEVWITVRGTEGLPLSIGGVPLPLDKRPRLVSQRLLPETFAAHGFVTFAEVPRGYAGMLFMHAMHASSGARDFFEGCYHTYDPHTDSPLADDVWPGSVLSTGFEDYFVSAYGFTAGVYAGHIAGLTYSDCTRDFGPGQHCAVSAYRMHDVDHLFFDDGFVLLWRVGERTDQLGRKCVALEGPTYGNPQNTTVEAYTFMYVWERGGVNVDGDRVEYGWSDHD